MHRVVSAHLLDGLPAIGEAKYLQGAMHGLDVSDFYLPGLQEMGSLSPGSWAWDLFVDQFVDELMAAADERGGWALPGAMYVMVDFAGSDLQADSRFQEFLDRTLLFLMDSGVSSMMIPGFALHRWIQLERERSMPHET